jgi:hypothetical protein
MNTTNAVDQPKKKTSTKKIIGIALLGLIGLCVICVAFGTYINSTPSGKATQTARALATQIKPVQGIVNTSRPGNTDVPVPTEPPPTNIPRPMLGMDLSQFVSKYDSLTDMQKKDFIGQSTGKWVSWTGTINDVKSNGTILVNISDTMLSTVSLEGVSSDVAIKLTKGQSINYEGRLSSIMDLLGLHIYLEDVQIVN